MTAIVLIGPMGSGKTSIGRRVAKQLGVGFTDSDAAIVRAHGAIAQIFADHGEAHFRALERDAVRDALAEGGVVALGGGAVLDERTRERLRDHRVVLLTVNPRVVAGRLRGTKRPLLQGDDGFQRWVDIYQQRRPLYEEAADVTFDTSSGPLKDIVEAVAQWARDTAPDKEQE